MPVLPLPLPLLLPLLLLLLSGAYAATGPDFAAAEGLLQSAVVCLGAAVEATPHDTRYDRQCINNLWSLPHMFVSECGKKAVRERVEALIGVLGRSSGSCTHRTQGGGGRQAWATGGVSFTISGFGGM
jgi:hypothetical protein